MTLRIRLGLLIAILTVWGTSAWAQTAGSLMVGGSPSGRDIALDRGFLIAKGTTLPQGRGYLSAQAPAFTVGAAYGVTDRLTVQAGTSLWTIADAPSLYGTARVGLIRSAAVNIAVGALGVVIFDEGGTTAAGWPYLTTTVGTDRVALTGLVGVGSSTSVFESTFSGKILLQGALEAFVTRGLEVIVETLYLGGDSDPAGAIGVRGFLGPVALEAGAIHVFEQGESDVPVVPWAGVSVRF